MVPASCVRQDEGNCSREQSSGDAAAHGTLGERLGEAGVGVRGSRDPFQVPGLVSPRRKLPSQRAGLNLGDAVVEWNMRT